jgi:peptide/nickel transport system permease protein
VTALRAFARNRGALIGAGLLLVLVAVAVLGPMLYPTDPWRMVQRPFMAPLAVDGFLLGTDTLGRDITAGIIHGARVSLLIGLVSTAVALLIGVPLGAVAGYFGGLVDDAAMRFTEIFQTIPSFALAIVLVAILQPSLSSIVLAIGIVSWPPIAAARARRGPLPALARIRPGRDHRRPVHLPHHLHAGPAQHAGADHRHGLADGRDAILLESSLSFLGLGDPNLMTWGYMIGAGRTRLIDAWWISFFPGVAIFLTVLALNLVGEGLNDALNPRLARGRG